MLIWLFEGWIASKTWVEALAEARRNSWSAASKSKPNQVLQGLLESIFVFFDFIVGPKYQWGWNWGVHIKY